MKKPPLSIIAILLSLLACGIALFKQPTILSTVDVQRTDSAAVALQPKEVNTLIKEALDRREKELIRDLAPKIVVMTKQLGTYEQLKPKSNPSSIEEMVAPFFKMVSTVGQ